MTWCEFFRQFIVPRKPRHYQRENFNSEVAGVSHFQRLKSLVFIIRPYGCREIVSKSPTSGYRSISLLQAQMQKQPHSAGGSGETYVERSQCQKNSGQPCNPQGSLGSPVEYKPNLW